MGLSIKIQDKTARDLNRLKEFKTDSYNRVIQTLINFYKLNKKNERQNRTDSKNNSYRK